MLGDDPNLVDHRNVSHDGISSSSSSNNNNNNNNIASYTSAPSSKYRLSLSLSSIYRTID